MNAPCGHKGEAVIGQFVRCIEGCDTTSKQTCLHSKYHSMTVQPWYMPSPQPTSHWCVDCGVRVFDTQGKTYVPF